MAIDPQMAERAALGPDEGYDSMLVMIVGSKGPANLPLAEREARLTVHRKHGVPLDDITAAEFAGRNDQHDPVYLVTWKLAERE